MHGSRGDDSEYDYSYGEYDSDEDDTAPERAFDVDVANALIDLGGVDSDGDEEPDEGDEDDDPFADRSSNDDENKQSERIRLGIARLGPQGLRTQTRDSDDSSDEY